MQWLTTTVKGFFFNVTPIPMQNSKQAISETWLEFHQIVIMTSFSIIIRYFITSAKLVKIIVVSVTILSMWHSNKVLSLLCCAIAWHGGARPEFKSFKVAKCMYCIGVVCSTPPSLSKELQSTADVYGILKSIISSKRHETGLPIYNFQRHHTLVEV